MAAFRNKGLPYAIAVAAIAAPAWAAADENSNPLGVYVGAGVGGATAQESPPQTGLLFNEHDTGWKVLAGLRPLPFFGAEIEYINFGNTSFSGFIPDGYANGDASEHALSASALAYVPLPVPFVDVYGKLGIARLEESYAIYSTSYSCTSSSCLASPIGIDRTVGDFTFGAGVQFHFGALAVRAEYERINDTFGSPEMYSVGATFTF